MSLKPRAGHLNNNYAMSWSILNQAVPMVHAPCSVCVCRYMAKSSSHVKTTDSPQLIIAITQLLEEPRLPIVFTTKRIDSLDLLLFIGTGMYPLMSYTVNNATSANPWDYGKLLNSSAPEAVPLSGAGIL